MLRWIHVCSVMVYALQDERYAYVVLRKCPRPALSGDISVARRLEDADETDDPSVFQPGPRSWRKSESKLRRAVRLQQALEGAPPSNAFFVVMALIAGGYPIC